MSTLIEKINSLSSKDKTLLEWDIYTSNFDREPLKKVLTIKEIAEFYDSNKEILVETAKKNLINIIGKEVQQISGGLDNLATEEPESVMDVSFEQINNIRTELITNLELLKKYAFEGKPINFENPHSIIVPKTDSRNYLPHTVIIGGGGSTPYDQKRTETIDHFDLYIKLAENYILLNNLEKGFDAISELNKDTPQLEKTSLGTIRNPDKQIKRINQYIALGELALEKTNDYSQQLDTRTLHRIATEMFENLRVSEKNLEKGTFMTLHYAHERFSIAKKLRTNTEYLEGIFMSLAESEIKKNNFVPVENYISSGIYSENTTNELERQIHNKKTPLIKFYDKKLFSSKAS